MGIFCSPGHEIARSCPPFGTAFAVRGGLTLHAVRQVQRQEKSIRSVPGGFSIAVPEITEFLAPNGRKKALVSGANDGSQVT